MEFFVNHMYLLFCLCYQYLVSAIFHWNSFYLTFAWARTVVSTFVRLNDNAACTLSTELYLFAPIFINSYNFTLLGIYIFYRILKFSRLTHSMCLPFASCHLIRNTRFNVKNIFFQLAHNLNKSNKFRQSNHRFLEK